MTDEIIGYYIHRQARYVIEVTETDGDDICYFNHLFTGLPGEDASVINKAFLDNFDKITEKEFKKWKIKDYFNRSIDDL